jgi:SAM-dependent methyltransferase
MCLRRGWTRTGGASRERPDTTLYFTYGSAGQWWRWLQPTKSPYMYAYFLLTASRRDRRSLACVAVAAAEMGGGYRWRVRILRGMPPSDEGTPPDLSERVRRGYDVLSYRYRADDADEGRYAPWIADLLAGLPARASVLDIGCGCGVPVARSVAAAGHRVTGVDISDVQIERARRLVPSGTFLRADAGDLTSEAFGPGSFDAVVSLYALIHMPLDLQAPLLRRIAGWLRPSGLLLVTVGREAWTGSDDNWLGGSAAMWWSQADARTYRSWLGEAGFEVSEERFVPEGGGGHVLFWARRGPL